MEDRPTDEDLDRTLDPIYVTDKVLYEAAHNPNILFKELLLGDAEQGFALDHNALAASYVPVHSVGVLMGVLCSFTDAARDDEALVASMVSS